VCHTAEDGKRTWNRTFKSFADYWIFDSTWSDPLELDNSRASIYAAFGSRCLSNIAGLR
jgi:hypothetical protein